MRALWAVLVMFSSGAASAQSTGIELSLRGAAALSLEQNAKVELARLAAHEAAAKKRESRGAFDFGLQASLSYDYELGFVRAGGREFEESKRDIVRFIGTEFQSLADSIRVQLSNEPLAFALCPPGLEEAVIEIVVDGVVVDEISACVSASDAADDELIFGIAGAIGASDIQDSLSTVNTELSEQLLDIFDEVGFRARRALRNFGIVPTDEAKKTFRATVSGFKTFSSSLKIGPSLSLEAVQDNFIGKRLSAGGGGKGILDKFRAVAAVDASYSFGRGRTTASALDRANEAMRIAGLESAAHAAATSVRDVALAYWRAREADDRERAARRVLDNATASADVVRRLVRSGRVPRMSRLEADARVVESRAAVEQASAAAIRARGELAEAVGLSASTLDELPLATDDWPDPLRANELRDVDVEELVRWALVDRPDLRAARYTSESAAILATSAADDEAPKLDVSAQVSIRGLHEGGNSTSIDDFLSGFDEALFGYHPGPSVKVSVTTEFPFRNRVARAGRTRAETTRVKSEIQLEDLRRTTVHEVVKLAGQVGRLADEVSARERVVERRRSVFADERERAAARRTTVAELIQAEESLSRAEESLVSARRVMAEKATELRYQLGGLIDYHFDGDEVVVETIYPLGYDFTETARRVPTRRARES